MASAPSVKEPTDSDPGDSTKWGAPDAVQTAQLLKGTHASEAIQPAAIDGTAVTLSAADQIISGVKKFKDAILKLRNPAESFDYIFRTSAITGDRNVTLPLLVANDVLLFESHAQAMANKSINADQNTITNIANDEIKAHINSKITQFTNLTDPSAAQEAATKAYVDNLLNGIKWKAPVRVATTTAQTLASDFENGDTIDGVVLATGDRILVKDQSAGDENGVYVVAASGAPARATDYDADSEVSQSAIFVREGTANADQAFVLTNDGAITLGTTALVFVQFTSLGQITAGTNLSKSGTTLNFDPTGGVDFLGENLDNIQNAIHDISTSGVDVDFSEDELQTISITGATTFTGTNYAAGKSKTIKLLDNGSGQTLAFPTGWIFVGPKPTAIAAGKTGILTLTCFGAAEANVVAAYAEEA